MNMTSTQVPAGWYPDPQGQGRRFWNGQQWTADVVPVAPVAVAVTPALNVAGVRSGLANGALGGLTRTASPLQFSLAGVAIVFVAGFLPWATGQIGGQKTGTAKGWTSTAPWLIGGPSTDDYLRGTATGGTSDFLFILAMVLASAACVFVALNRPSPNTHRFLQAGAGLGALAALVSIAEIVHMNGVLSDLGDAYGANGSVSVGAGFFLTLAGCALVATGAVKAALARAQR